MVTIDDSDLEGDGDERPQYLEVELLSTVSFKEIDIDKMLEHTTLDDFLKGLSNKNFGQQSADPSKVGQPVDEQQQMMEFLQGGGAK